MINASRSSGCKMDMTIPAKKLKRLENKKQKVAAFLELTKHLEDNDSEKNHTADPTHDVSSITGMGPWTAVPNSESKDKDLIDLSQNEYLKLKEELRQRKRYLKTLPQIHLKDVGHKASISHNDPESLVPLFVADFQHLLLYTVFGGPYHPPYLPPRWCHHERCQKTSHIILFIIDGASSYTFSSNESVLPTLSKEFTVKTEFISPYCYGSDIVTDLSVVKLTRAEEEKLSKRFGQIAFLDVKNVEEHKKLKSAFPINFENICSKVPNGGAQDESSSPSKKKPRTDRDSETVSSPLSLWTEPLYSLTEPLPSTDKFSRVLLLLSPRQMIEDGYPLPLRGELRKKFADYKLTKEAYAEVSSNSPLFGLDCEMCLTAEGQELTRIALVSEQHEVLYDSLVKPVNKIINYLTPYSGITKKMLDNVTKRLEDVQDDIQAILPPDAILVGQSLNMDLQAMKMMHPYVIDTSVVFNLSGNRRMKPKLSRLASEFLNIDIQQSASGHDSVEDSLASLKLVQLKLANSLEFGDSVLNRFTDADKDTVEDTEMDVVSEVKSRIEEKPDIKNQRKKSDLSESEIILQYWKQHPYCLSSLFKHTVMDGKTAAVISGRKLMDSYSKFLPDTSDKMRTIVTSSDKETVSKTCSVAKDCLLTVSHISIAPGDQTSDRLAQIDNWCKDLEDSVKESGLLIVMFPGMKDSNANGLAFLKVVNPPCPILTKNLRKIAKRDD